MKIATWNIERLRYLKKLEEITSVCERVGQTFSSLQKQILGSGWAINLAFRRHRRLSLSLNFILKQKNEYPF